MTLKKFIENRMRELEIGRAELVRRMGYKNLSKGLKRLKALEDGDLEHADALLGPLATGLGVTMEEAAQVITAEREAQRRAQEAERRAKFRPQALLRTELTRPSSITMAAMVGADRYLWIDFPEGIGSESYLDHVLMNLPESVMFFGKVVGFVINYTPDLSIEYGLDGTRITERAYALEGPHLSWRVG